jgi:hypothetical protein
MLSTTTKPAGKAFVMHWIGSDRLRKLLTEKQMHLGHLALFHLLTHHTNTRTGRIHVTAKRLAEHWDLPPARVRSYLKHLLRLQVLARCPDPENGGSFLVPHPFMASAGTDARREKLWDEYKAGLGEDAEHLLDMPSEAELTPSSARRKFKKRSRLDGPRFAPGPGGTVIAGHER